MTRLQQLRKEPLVGQELVQALWAKRPKWYRERSQDMAADQAGFLLEAVAAWKPKTMLEVGVASGWTSAMLLSAAKHFDEDSVLYGLDSEEYVYFDESRPVGAALAEAMPDLADAFRLMLSATTVSARDALPERIDFVFLDGNHSHPWPTIDLLMLLPRLVPGSVVVVHDIAQILPGEQGAGILFDCWQGGKTVAVNHSSKRTLNIGAIQIPSDDAVVVPWLLESLGNPWQVSHEWSAVLGREEIDCIWEKLDGSYGSAVAHACKQLLDAGWVSFKTSRSAQKVENERQRVLYEQLRSAMTSVSSIRDERSNGGEEVLAGASETKAVHANAQSVSAPLEGMAGSAAKGSEPTTTSSMEAQIATLSLHVARVLELVQLQSKTWAQLQSLREEFASLLGEQYLGQVAAKLESMEQRTSSKLVQATNRLRELEEAHSAIGQQTDGEADKQREESMAQLETELARTLAHAAQLEKKIERRERRVGGRIDKAIGVAKKTLRNWVSVIGINKH